MGEHGAHPNAFVRSFSARGELGGLSRAARGGDRLPRRRRLRPGHRRDRRHRPVGNADRRARRHARRRLSARARRRRPGAQGRHARDRRRARGQQGRPAAGRADGARDARDAAPAPQPPAGAWKPRVVVVRALAEGGIDGLLEALEAHAPRWRPAGAGATPRRSPAPSPPIPDPTAIAPGDADGWRARLQALAARDGLCATLGITVARRRPGPLGGGDDGRARGTSTSTAAATAARSSRSPTAPSAWRRTRTGRWPPASTRTSPTRPASAPASGWSARATEVSRSRRIAVYRIDVVRPTPGGGETAVSSFTGTVSIKA